jgi:hypothetical protein
VRLVGVEGVEEVSDGGELSEDEGQGEVLAQRDGELDTRHVVPEPKLTRFGTATKYLARQLILHLLKTCFGFQAT